MDPKGRDNVEVNWDTVGDYVASVSFPSSPVPRPKSATRLQEAREKAGLTRAQLAKRSGVHLSTIIKLEQGAEEPIPTTTAALAAALQVKLD